MLDKFKIKDTRNIYFYILLVLCIGILSFMMSYGLIGNDYWWHVKAGEWIVENMKIPTTAIYSWNAQAQNLDWVAHEWLSEVVIYLVKWMGGSIGIYVFCFICSVALLLLLYSVCKEKVLNNIFYAALFFIFTTALFKIYVYARPHVFSYFLLFAELKILYDFINEKNKKAVYLVPVIGILWANFHGGSSSIVYVLCIFFIITGLFNFQFGKVEFTRLKKDSLITLGIVTVLSMVGICINPYGVHMLSYPYINMADTLMLDLISEWASPDAKEMTILIFFFIPFAIGLISILTTKKNIKAVDLIIFAFFSYMFFRSSRFLVFLMISLPFYAFDYIPEFGKLKPLETKVEKTFAGGLFAVMFAIIVFGFINCGNTYKNGDIISHDIDKEFIELIKQEAPERPFTDYNYGAELIYNEVDVFVDGRADIYTGIPLADYYNLVFVRRHRSYVEDYAESGFIEDILEKYNFDAFLIDKSRPFYQYLTSHPDKYEQIKDDETTAYFRVIG